jgi:hypothetical protein
MGEFVVEKVGSMKVWIVSLLMLLSTSAVGVAQQTLRPPAVPLVACDPYFSIWSPSNRLAESNTTHWTGRPHRLQSNVTIDGVPWRILGTEPATVVPLRQSSVQVLPTRTICELESPNVALTVTFTTPALPESIDLLSWPVTYVTYSARSLDGKDHDVIVDFEANGEIAVNDVTRQKVVWSNPEIDGLSTIAFGSETQAILNRSGDDLRIDWGYCYVSAPKSQKPQWNKQQLQLSLGKVGKEPVTQWLIMAYDDLYSIQYMGQNLRPYWRRNGWQAEDLLKAAAAQYADLTTRCEEFDQELMADLTEAGGANYAQLCALCYRQCFAAGKFVADRNGQPLQFSKENHSNGCIATSDVFYPMAPQFLMFGPSLTKSFLVPFMNYAASERWKFPFAPHDLGQYPLANGQVYGGGERSEENQMPVEECGNILLLIAATAQMEGTPEFANLYWKQVEQWAEYLMKEGFDPANQLCTDDFAGHMAHNVNLSAKAICAIGAYGRLCEMRGDTAKAEQAFSTAREFAKRWMKEANDGDHYRLAFDRKGSWSQKYNLIWDRILNLNLFPSSVVETEIAYYRRTQNPYGLPLDNRETYSKLDWIVWSATLTQNQNDFDALIDPVVAFINETPDRSPLTDWYQTKTARKVGFTARPVVGGVFVKVLYDQTLWKKWASRDMTAAADWAPIPKRPLITQIVPVATTQPVEWKYSLEAPDDDWFRADFDATEWKSGRSGFGTAMTPGVKIGTQWNTPDIWLVRDIELTDGNLDSLHWMIHHDEDVEIYVNGELTEKFAGYLVQYETRPLSEATRKHLKPGKNRIAVHCHQETGGQYIDLGLVTVQQVD